MSTYLQIISEVAGCMKKFSWTQKSALNSQPLAIVLLELYALLCSVSPCVVLLFTQFLQVFFLLLSVSSAIFLEADYSSILPSSNRLVPSPHPGSIICVLLPTMPGTYGRAASASAMHEAYQNNLVRETSESPFCHARGLEILCLFCDSLLLFLRPLLHFVSLCFSLSSL